MSITKQSAQDMDMHKRSYISRHWLNHGTADIITVIHYSQLTSPLSAVRFPALHTPISSLTNSVVVRVNLAVEVGQVRADGVSRHEADHASKDEEHYQLVAQYHLHTASTHRTDSQTVARV